MRFKMAQKSNFGTSFIMHYFETTYSSSLDDAEDWSRRGP